MSRLLKGAPAPQELRDEFDIDMRVLGIISSERMLLSETAIDLGHWRERFDRCAPPRAERSHCGLYRCLCLRCQAGAASLYMLPIFFTEHDVSSKTGRELRAVV